MNPELEQAAKNNLLRIKAEVALQCDDTYTGMKYRLDNFSRTIGYRVLRGDALDSPELEIILGDARELEQKMKAYKESKLQP